MKKFWFAIPALLAAAAACESASDPGPVCPAVVLPALNVTVLDSLSGNNITPGTSLILRTAAGAVADSVVAPVTPGGPLTQYGVGHEGGVYSITLRKTGYYTWTKNGIQVQQESCGPKTVNLTVRLYPTS